MSISNLHSLLNGPWYINENYAIGNLPLLLNILEGKPFTKGEEIIASIVSETTTNQSASVGNSVAVLAIKSPIFKYSQECGPRGTKAMMKTLDGFKNNSDIAGVVLDIDSGGGQVYGTPEFYDYIKTYPKPIVAYTDGLMASAAYYIGNGASHIIANQRADAIGSIGAYAQILDLTGFYEKQGAKIHTIYSSLSTEKNKAYRDALKGDYKAYIKEGLDPSVETFINDMKLARPGINEDAYKGATYNATEALNNGLIDEIGTLQTAIDKVFELATINKSQNNTTMNKEFKRVQAALGLETAFESNEQGVYLNEEQLQTIESLLETHETTIANTALQNTATEVTSAIDTALQNTATEVTSAIDAALANAEVERGMQTDVEAIAALSALIEEYGKGDGATATKIKDDGAIDETKNSEIISGVNVKEALNC